jgi:hypothetical protein
MVGIPRRSTEPFDGVRPEDHPETYSNLLAHRCFKQKPEIEHIIDINNYETVYCSQCYRAEEIPAENEVTFHRNLHNVEYCRLLPLDCDKCGKILQNIRQIIECGICTDFFLSLKP